MHPKTRKSKPLIGSTCSSIENGPVIKEPLGILSEYTHLEQQCGKRGEDWTLVSQSLWKGPDGFALDQLTVKMKDGTIREFFFDISSIFGK